MQTLHPYLAYYGDAIRQETNGLKLVLDGTGLGKTSAIVDVVASVRTDRKFIYCANRLQLLHEMGQRLRAREIACVRQQTYI